MSVRRFVHGLTFSMVSLGLVLHPVALPIAAEEPLEWSADHTSRMPALIPADIRLQPGGVLLGALVNERGRAVRDTPVAVYHNHNEVVRTVSNNRGRFLVRGLRGGVYRLVTPHAVAICRAWSPGTAPPAARKAIIVVTSPTIRAQYDPAVPPGPGPQHPVARLLTNPGVVGTLVATAIAVPLIIDNDDAPEG